MSDAKVCSISPLSAAFSKLADQSTVSTYFVNITGSSPSAGFFLLFLVNMNLELNASNK